jgi:AcrR family transcriptional regulator
MILRFSTRPAVRADAAKNRDRIVVEARDLFSSATGTVSLEAIARAAGVGIGTLYRHFPTKETLVEAVYAAELDALDVEADMLLVEHASADAMRKWINAYAKFVATKHAMHDALRIALTPQSGAGSETRSRINRTIDKFLAAGTTDGSIRNGIRADDL